MNTLALISRTARYFRGVNLALVAGMAIATTVLTGAMMVGDSVRQSLADLAVERLGEVDDALIATRFFPQSLAERLRSSPEFAGRVQIVPGIIVRGGATDDRAGTRTADVQVAALGEDGTGHSWVQVAPGNCLLNGELAGALTASVKDTVLLSVPLKSDLPRDAALARRGRNDTVASVRATVAEVVADPGMASLFNPNGSQRVPRNAWTNLADLQDAIDHRGQVNVLLTHYVRAKGSKFAASYVVGLNAVLRRVATLDDYGLDLKDVPGGHQVALMSRETYIPPPIVAAAQRIARDMGVPLQAISVNLLTAVTASSQDNVSGKVIHYAVAAGVSFLDDQALKDDEVAVNQWTADQLGIKVGDRLRLDFLQRSANGDLLDASRVRAPGELMFRVARVLPMEGIGADPTLPPNYKGLTDADSVADWDPPEGLNIDKRLVTDADEGYWRKYHAAPKLFLSLPAAQKLWGGTWGEVTGLRIPAGKSAGFARQLRDAIDPAAMGLAFRPLRVEQLAAATGGTDFSMYFVAFSFFLIVAAVLLVAMLFRLSVEQRARQLGLLSAVGFRPRALRGLALAEGMVLALIGGMVGLAGAVGYTWLMMAGLRTWWIGAVGTTAMHLHIVPVTLATGFVSSLVVAFFAILWAIWRIGRVPVAALLAGGWGGRTGGRRDGRILRGAGLAGVALGIAILVSSVSGKVKADEAFLGGGGVLLAASLCFLAGWLRPRRHSGVSFAGAFPLERQGIGNASRHTARGVLASSLIALAAFTLVTIAVMRQGGSEDTADRKSGAGGYQLILQADIPLLGDLNKSEGRKLLGLRQPDAPSWKDAHFTSLRRWAGQDISCLNLTRPTSPTILSVPPAMVDRAAFSPARIIRPAANSNFWTLLGAQETDGAIPVIADDDTAQYVLQLDVGGDMPITDALGNPRKLRLVATVAHSIFQGELLMGEGNFRRLFPTQDGYSIVLIDVPQDQAGSLAKVLSSELDDYSVSVDTTAARLAMYGKVANTYLSTFQTLGSLGLLLGTIGLAVVLVRSIIERRAELALLAALGFRPSARIRLVLAENAFLLVLGLLVGTTCALIGVIPALFSPARSINLSGVAWTLLAVLATGLLASTAAVRLSGMHAEPSDLRRE